MSKTNQDSTNLGLLEIEDTEDGSKACDNKIETDQPVHFSDVMSNSSHGSKKAKVTLPEDMTNGEIAKKIFGMVMPSAGSAIFVSSA